MWDDQHLCCAYPRFVGLLRVHYVLVTSQVEYCIVLPIGLPLKTTWKIQLFKMWSKIWLHTMLAISRFIHVA